MTGNPSLETHPNVEDWIVVRADGGGEVRMGKVEIGQGIDIAVALIVADELGVPFDRVAMTPVSTGLPPDEGYTASRRCALPPPPFAASSSNGPSSAWASTPRTWRPGTQ